MKRCGQLMPRIATRENLGLAYHKAAAGKRQAPAVRRFAAGLDAELSGLVRELGGGTWQPGAFQRFVVRDPKVRVIHAAPFRDRVAHHALMNVAGPCFERGAVADSYACRTGRGNLAAVKAAAHGTRANRFFLKLDIRRYFDSIHHDTLRTLFRRLFKDGSFLALLDQVLDSFSTREGHGLPIGTLTSQYFANLYLDGMDHWIRETLGCRSYVRYMDDFVLWHREARVLEQWQEEIRAWLAGERHLELKATPGAAACAEGVAFLGYRVLPGRVLLGRPARHRFFQRLHGYERQHAAGEMTSQDLQRRADALIAFTKVASCDLWRRRGLALLPSAADEPFPQNHGT